MSLHASKEDIQGVFSYSRIKEIGLRDLYRIILQVLCEKKIVEDVENVVQDIMGTGASVNEKCLYVIMKMCNNEGLLYEARMFFGNYCFGREISSKNYTAIIDAYVEKGCWKEAQYVFYAERTRGQKKDVVEYNVNVKAYGKAKVYDKALTLFESMRASGTWPDGCTYNTPIQMLCAGELMDRARELLRKMKEAGSKPRYGTCSAIISGYYHIGFVFELRSTMK